MCRIEWPSAEEIASNAELRRMCDILERTIEENKRLTEHLDDIRKCVMGEIPVEDNTPSSPLDSNNNGVHPSAMLCPSCDTEMMIRSGKFGKFWFCPNQHQCNQSTITYRSEENNGCRYTISDNSLYHEAQFLESELTGMERISYENDREFEHTRDRAGIDNDDIVFGGMFSDMGREDDDEDQRPW